MKKNRNELTVRKVDKSLSILDLFDGKNFSFDVVIGLLNGKHPKLINKISDRAYYILKGEGWISVDEELYKVVVGDLIAVKKGQIHSLEGDMEYLIITSPKFDPNNEIVL